MFSTHQNPNDRALFEIAGRIAARSAAEYLRVHGLRADAGSLAHCCQSWIKAKFPEALHDAKAAFYCGMVQAGEATFQLSMAQAGIEAAKEAGWPAGLCSALEAEGVLCRPCSV